MSSPRCGKCDCCKRPGSKHSHHHKHSVNQTRFRSKSQPAQPTRPTEATMSTTPQRLQRFDYDSNRDMQATQRANLFSLLRNEKFCDLKFVVGPTKTVIKANRIFLASISTTFEQLLYPADETHTPSEVHFPDVSASAFESVLHFAYGNDPRIDAENVLALKYICERFEIGTLSAICNEFWRQTLNPENICALLNQAVLINSAEFVRECISRFAVCARVMIDSAGFQHMNLKAMLVFLQTDGLRVAEHRLWQSILSWADYQCSNGEPGAMLNHSQSFSAQARTQQRARAGGGAAGHRSKSMSISKHISVEFELLREDNETGNDDDLKQSEVATPHSPMTDIAEEAETTAFKVVTVQTVSQPQPQPPQQEGSEVYDVDGNRTGGDSYLEAMASDKDDEVPVVDYNIVVTQPLEQVYDDDDDPKHAPCHMNVVQPKDRNALLRCLKRSIRWSAMSGKYFVQHVIPERIFDKDELVTILAFFHCPDLSCGEFLTEPRWSPQGKPIAMQRGAIDLAKWTYPGGKRMDAIVVECNADATLTAIGVFDCKAQCSAQVLVYRGDNGKHGNVQVVAESAEQVFTNGDEATNVVRQLPLKEPVLLQRHVRYTIELLQQNEEQEISYQVKDGQSEVLDDDTHFGVKFSKAAVSKNGSNVAKGAIPTLYFDLK